MSNIVKKDTEFWRTLAPEGPWRRFQVATEAECGGMSVKSFVDYWSEKLGYSKSSVSQWLTGSRSIPLSALEKIGIEISPEEHQRTSFRVAMPDAERQARARQMVINRMCGGCALGDRFCRITDCPLRPFSPLPLHPKAVPMGWDDAEADVESPTLAP